MILKTHNHKDISILEKQNLVLHTNQIFLGILIVPRGKKMKTAMMLLVVYKGVETFSANGLPFESL